MSETSIETWHGTTILAVRKSGRVVIAGDGQVSFGQTVIKANARKVRPLGDGSVIAGFAGATADAFTLFERLEGKLEQHPGQLMRACVEMAKDWRTDARNVHFSADHACFTPNSRRWRSVIGTSVAGPRLCEN